MPAFGAGDAGKGLLWDGAGWTNPSLATQEALDGEADARQAADDALTAALRGDPLDAGGLTARLNLIPDGPAENGLTLQRPDDDAWGIGQAYGAGQFFELLRRDLPPAGKGSGPGGAIVDPDDRVLFRVDRTGGLGVGGGVHVATGMRQDAGYDAGGVSVWIDAHMDVTPLVINSKVQPGFAQTHDLLTVNDGTVDPIYSVFRLTNTGRAKAGAGMDVTTRVIANPSIRVTAMAAQTGELVRVERADATKALSFDNPTIPSLHAYANDGATIVALLASGDAGAFGARLQLLANSPATIGLYLKAAVGQTADLTRWASGANATLSRVDKNGYFVTKKNAAPADADLVAGELALWLDQTPGATKAMFKAKDSGGTVRSASVALA